MSSWITWPHPTPCDQWPQVVAYEDPWAASVGDGSSDNIDIVSEEASRRFLEKAGSKPRVLRSACAPCSEKWTNQYLISAVQEGLEVDIDVGPPICRQVYIRASWIVKS